MITLDNDNNGERKNEKTRYNDKMGEKEEARNGETEEIKKMRKWESVGENERTR